MSTSQSLSSFRFVRAYRATFRILSSYLWLWAKKGLFGDRISPEKVRETHRRNALRIEKTVLELKGIFIKVGQMISIMTNFLPEELTQGLEKLQDAVPPHPYGAIEERFVQEFGKKPSEIFEKFESVPIASASLGQVHTAFLKEGTKVAVKIQYPEIDRIVQIDLKILRRIFGLFHLFFPSYGLRDVFREIAVVINQELDYQYEGKNLELIKKNFIEETGFLFPTVCWNFSTRKILTLHFMEGIKISSLETLRKAGVDTTEIATRLIHAYCKQIFLDGVYHADPHPGNLLVQVGADKKARLVLVDFGATARISPAMQQGIVQFAEGLIKKDTRLLSSAMRQMGFVAKKGDFEAFDKLVDYFYEKLRNLKIENFKNLENLQNIENLFELKKLNISFRDLMTSFHVPQDWILLERTLLLVMGLCAHLDPQLNPVHTILPYVEKFVLKDKSFTDYFVELTKEIGISYLQLPHEIHKTLKKLNDGRIEVRLAGLNHHTERLTLLVHQLIYSAFALTGTTLWFLGYGVVPGYGAFFFGCLLFISMIKNRRQS
ncbi:MAG: AarF/ABC1/UbiB kinase family protein [Deltaproteobacteria bacterium]|nr:AarF/ABC1/UbiB kinase family protein [Deltaproteobacteria bacterium]